MDFLATSLEALIQRATNAQNEKPDIAAIEAFCIMLGKESKGVHIAGRLLATYVQSGVEKEALQALTLLDTCMKRCGRTFHAEIGKFRFLNVMIKLVSPKYLGDKTAPAVRHKILQLLSAWTKDYPKETKIRETYEMLKKQGIIKDPPASPVTDVPELTGKSTANVKSPLFEDEETTKLLQELLRSKDPFDLKLANKLIKSMVKDDEKRIQLNCQRNMELETVRANVKLLSEMLDSYDPEKSSIEDVELMKELYDACERLKPTVTRLAYETRDNDETIGHVLEANDELTRVFEKYTSVIVLKRGASSSHPSLLNNAVATSLLDLSSPLNSIDYTFDLEKKKSNTSDPASNVSKSDIELLGDIFGSLGTTSTVEPQSLLATEHGDDSALLFPGTSIMQPIAILPTSKTKETTSLSVQLDSKARALEDLNQLGETLLKESLSRTSANGGRDVKNNVHLVGNVVSSTSLSMKDAPTNASSASSTGTRSAISTMTNFPIGSNGFDGMIDNNGRESDFSDLLNTEDDAMLDASSCPPAQATNPHSEIQNDQEKREGQLLTDCLSSASIDQEVKPLNDIRLTIDDIKPGTIPPLTVIEEKNGISVVLHFAKGSPRPDITVIVVTTMSKNSKPLSNYLFQAVVSKHCKSRLELPSGTQLPGHNPFLPPSAITQIMLIANPRKDPVSLKFMLSYTMDDETLTEMRQVDQLPMID